LDLIVIWFCIGKEYIIHCQKPSSIKSERMTLTLAYCMLCIICWWYRSDDFCSTMNTNMTYNDHIHAINGACECGQNNDWQVLLIAWHTDETTKVSTKEETSGKQWTLVLVWEAWYIYVINYLDIDVSICVCVSRCTYIIMFVCKGVHISYCTV
jgi:hypothetical protein